MDKKSETTFQDITSFIETSDVIQEYFKKQKLDGGDTIFPLIEKFLKDRPSREEDNLPLVFDAGDELINKTLICAWIEHHNNKQTSQNFKDVIVPHFASAGGNNTNYFYAIYKILINLRVD